MNFYELTKCLPTKKYCFVRKPRGYGKKTAMMKKGKIDMATYSGSGKKISAKQKKAAIMAANDWTEEEYKKQYDLFKNKLRAYESYKGARLGLSRQEIDATRQSPQELLYRAAKAKRREGAAYRPSLEMQRIQSFSAVSITKGRKLAEDLTSEYSRRRGEAFARTTAAAFAGFIRDVPKAQEIVAEIEDPVKREEALKALAEHIHAKQKPSGEVFAGEVYGSDDAGEDFDYSPWLEY